ncbi:hypothetical protein LAYK6_18350 [Lactobacillus amylovorus subsp. amylovorus]|nr:hypothetical protein LAYK6_18350 [Lactobacillus amylovorus]
MRIEVVAAIKKWRVRLIADDIVQIVDVVAHIEFDNQAIRVIASVAPSNAESSLKPVAPISLKNFRSE